MSEGWRPRCAALYDAFRDKSHVRLGRDYYNRNIRGCALAQDAAFHDYGIGSKHHARQGHAYYPDSSLGWLPVHDPVVDLCEHLVPWAKRACAPDVPPMCPRQSSASLPSWSRVNKGGESACRPGSVPRLRGAAVIHLGLTLPTASCGLPASIGRAALDRSRRDPLVPLLDLAPGGVYQAAAVTCRAGGLLHRRFTLTPRTRRGAVCFLWHCPAGHPGSALPTTLPCGARTFLTGLAPGATARPTHPRSGYASSVDRAGDLARQVVPRLVVPLRRGRLRGGPDPGRGERQASGQAGERQHREQVPVVEVGGRDREHQ